jgi:hypothetical protein
VIEGLRRARERMAGLLGIALNETPSEAEQRRRDVALENPSLISKLRTLRCVGGQRQRRRHNLKHRRRNRRRRRSPTSTRQRDFISC